MAGNSGTASSAPPALGGVQVQTSLYGLAVPLFWGRVRVGGNLVWYGDFKAIPVTDTAAAGGKGGGSSQGSVSWRYEAAVILSLGAGPINGVLSAWKGKQRFAGQVAGTRYRTLTHNVTVPAGGVVTVPQAADFTSPVAVRDPNNIWPGLESPGM